MVVLFSYKGLVTLDEMKAKREDLVREHEKQLAAKLKSDEAERLAEVIVFFVYLSESFLRLWYGNQKKTLAIVVFFTAF